MYLDDLFWNFWSYISYLSCNLMLICFLFQSCATAYSIRNIHLSFSRNRAMHIISNVISVLQLNRQPLQFRENMLPENNESWIIGHNDEFPVYSQTTYVKQVNGAWVTRGRGQDSRKILSLPAFCKFGSWEIKFLSLWLGHIWKSSKISQWGRQMWLPALNQH